MENKQINNQAELQKIITNRVVYVMCGDDFPVKVEHKALKNAFHTFCKELGNICEIDIKDPVVYVTFKQKK